MKTESIRGLVLSLFTTCAVLAQEGPGWKQAPRGSPAIGPPASAEAPPVRTASSAGPRFAGAGPGANCPGTVQVQTGQPAISEAITPEITALAGNLENDPKRIYDYVHNYIKYVHYFGSKKGALLTLLEGSGNDFDQCALLTALLRAAEQNLGTPNAYTVKYQFGVSKMTYESQDSVDLKDWLGLNLVEAPDLSNYSDYLALVNDMNYLRGFPLFPLFPPQYVNDYLLIPQTGPNSFDLNAFIFHRVWVKLAYAGGSTYCLDPAFKTSTFIQGIDLASAMQFNLSDLLTQTSSGATVTADYAQNLNWNNLSSKLTTYTASLLADLKTTHPNYSLEQVISGYVIQESERQTFPGLPFAPLDTSFMVFDTTYNGASVSVPVLEWDNIPGTYLSTIQLQIAAPDTVNVTYYLPALQARKLSLTFVNNQAIVSLDDSQDQVGLTGIATDATMTTTITHPFGSWDFTGNAISPLDHRFDQTDLGRVYQRTAAGCVVTFPLCAPSQP